MKEWKNKFIEELKKQIGKRYALGGGQMKKWKGYDNLDNKGNWVGFDCCGGIMHALRQATEINLTMRNVPGMMQAPWLYPVTEMALQESDLIFVDIPGKNENGNVMRDENGYPIYGKFNHVMTYLGSDYIITTEGEGGDFRINPKSKTKTQYFKFSRFKIISAKIFEDTTRYIFMRINWEWLRLWKKNHEKK